MSRYVLCRIWSEHPPPSPDTRSRIVRNIGRFPGKQQIFGSAYLTLYFKVISRTKNKKKQDKRKGKIMTKSFDHSILGKTRRLIPQVNIFASVKSLTFYITVSWVIRLTCIVISPSIILWCGKHFQSNQLKPPSFVSYYSIRGGCPKWNNFCT